MSVEDPRLSSISEENLTENFSSEIQEEIAASSTPSPIEHEIQVAQAGDGRTPTTNRVPTDPNAPAAAPATPAAEVTPDANNIVHLATSVSIDDIRVDGANLILVQADGTEIVIVNGAAKIPTMLIGEVEVPQQVLFAALEDSGINVAAGPDGSFSATGRPDSSGAEFEDSIQGSQNDPIQLASLLGDTEFGDGGGLDDRTAADDQPDAFDMGSPFIFSESVLADDVVGNETITGTLAFDGGDDFGIVSSVNYQSTSDMAEGTGSGVAAPLTSGGQPVTVSTSPDGLTVTGTITVGETTVTVFTLTVTNPTTGAFTYTQSQPLDHPDLGQIGADDALRLNFTFTVTDKDGDSDTGSFSIEIGDDGPSIGGAVTLVSVDEDDLSNGNDEGEARESLVSSADLGISWGADSNVKGESEGDAFGRSIAFVNSGLPQGLTSDGVTVVYGAPTASANGTVTITAYKGNVEGPAVFTVTLDPTSEHGTATFELKGPLDHASESDALPLTFNYTATDADGDSQAGSFSVTVDDDIPTVGKPVLLNGVDEDDLPLGNDLPKESRTSSAELGISWGADDAKVGDADATTHRALSFSGLSSALAGLTSDGYALQVGPDGVTSLPNGGETVTIYNTHGDAVFRLTLDPTTEGGNAKFELLGNLDHRAGGEAVDQLTLNFGFTATDSDGDAVDGGFSIIVADDAPVWLGATDSTVEEEELPGGNEDTSGSGDADFKLFGGFVDLTQKSSFGSLGILWGADNNNPTPGAGLNDRSVAFGGIVEGALATYGNDVVLKSNGEDVKYHLADDGRTLIGYTGESFEGGTVVFTVTVSDDGILGAGRYDFTLNATLDHPAGGSENKINLDFDFIAKDSDGDSVGGSFTVSVIDDTPVQGTVGTNAGLNEDDVSTYSATDATSADIRKTDAASLGISWGSDDDVRGAGDTYGRTVGFANSAGTIASAITTTDASTFGLSVTGGTLTSGGNALNYVLTSDVSGGQTLTAYIQGTETKVFQIVLDPTASKGSYTVEIFNELDHAEGSNSATLSFKFVGTDADGDHAAVGTATVTIADDQLVVGTPQSGDVDEDGWTQLASGGGNWFGDGDSPLVDTVTTRSLNISWGADNANDNVNGGYVGAQVAGDRSVVFGTNSVPADLTSNGFKIVYEVGANGTELIAYRQQNGSYYDADGNVVDAAAKASAAVFKVSLSDAGSGSYTFTLLDNIDQARGNEENNTDLNFQFIARDADGDQVTKSFSVSIDDDTPVVGFPSFSGGVDEDDIGTAAGATSKSLNISWGADQGNAVANGGHSNADGDRYVVFDGNSAPNGLTSNGHAIRYETSLNGTLLTAYRYEDGHYVGANGENLGADKAGAAVFTVGLSDQGSGSYTFTLIDNLDHGGLQGGRITLGFDFTAVDGDGDDADGSFFVSIDDDTPSLTSVAASSVDEDGLFGGNAGESYPGATGTNADLAGASTTTGAVSLGVSWGADADIKSEYLGDNRDYDDDPIGREINFVRAVGGQATEISTGKISDNNVSSYLGSAFANLKSDGVSLDYRIDYLRDGSGNWNGGYVLTAYKDGTDPTVAANQVFKVTLDPTAANGSYKFDLLGNLDHSGTNAEDNLDLTFNFRATDSDGDSTGRGSFTVTIDDDAPIASVVTVAGNALLGDETAGADAGTDDMAGALPSAFSSLGTALGWSQQANMVSTAGNNYGADGAGSQSLALTKADGGVFNGESSGIQTLNGSDVKLYTEGNLVVGKVGATVVFALLIDGNGTVSMAQYQPIKHGDAANANETASVNGVYVTTTISDREGDTARATTSTALDIKVRDDAPTVSPTQTGVTVDEDGLSSGNSAGPAYTDDAASNSKTASANLSYNFGTDGIAGEATNIVFQTSNLASLALKSFGTSLSYAWDNSTNTLTATAGNAGPVVFTLKVTDVATGAYTFTLERPLDHSATSGANMEDDINIDFNFTIRDGDGDPASGAVRVTIDDDAPYIGSPEAETVSEVNLPYTLGDEASADSDSSTVQRGNLDIHWGADNRDAISDPDISVRFGANSAPSGLTSNGEIIKYDVGGTTLTAYTGSGFGARIIFTVSLDDNGSGQYTFKLYDNIDHTNADAASKTLSFNFIAEDSDNDEASGSFTVTIADGGPSVGVVENETVNENALPNNILDAIFADTDGSTVQHGDLNINWGADDNNSGSFNRSVTFNAALNGADSGLTHDGTAIMYTLSPDGTVLTAKAGATTVFTVSLSDSDDGSYTFILNDNIDHLGANGSSATLNFGFTAKDSDGDTAPGSFAVTIVDDTPEADTPSRQFLEEDSGSPAVSNVSLGIDWKSDDNNNGSANRSVAFANATPAANITNAAGQPITLTSSGQTLSYALLAGVLVAYVNGDPAIAANRVFEVSLNDNGSGSYTFTLHQPLDHGAPISNDDAYLDLRFLYTATDSDGDGDNASFTVRVDAAGNVTNNGNNISYDDLNSGVFVNLGDNSVTVNGQTVAGDTATDLAAVGDKVLGIDRMNGIVNVTGGDGNDILVGSSQANTIRGGAGNDTIIGNGGDDTLEGDAGNDLFIYKVGDGNDRINGGTETSNTSPNYDVLRVEGDTQARTFNIGLASGGPAINAGSGNAADIAVSYNGSNSGTIRADEIEGIDIVAGSGAITVNVGNLAGTAVQPNTIRVTGSNSATGDVVDASGITAANAVSVVFDGNEGNDTFIGGAGNDVARGGTGNDTFTGGLGADAIEGGAGNDIINLGADQIVNGLARTMDSIDGGADYDKIVLTTGTQGFLLDGNVTTITRVEEITGTDGNDTITLRDDYLSDQASGGVTINGGKGNDTITGGKGNDVITGGEGTDTLKGGAGADTLIGGADNDVFWGGKHSDNLFGNGTTNVGDDLYAKAGEQDKAMFGSDPSNYEVTWNAAFQTWEVLAKSGAIEFGGSTGPGLNVDRLFGIELIQFANGVVLDLTDPIRVFNGTNLIGTYDTIQQANDASTTLAGYRIELVGTVTNELATITKNNLTVVGGVEDTGIVLTLNGAQNITLQGDAPINVIGDGQANAILGNDGANVIKGVMGGDTLDGGAGNDTFVLGADVTGSGTRDIQLGDGSLRAVDITGLAGTGDRVIGGTGSDTIILERDGKSGFVADYTMAPGYLSGVEKIVGTDGNDVILLAAGSTADGGPITIEGGEGNDVLGGSNSADILSGGNGNDLISGLGGNDILEGGAGSDEIWGGAGNDQINGGSGIDNITGGLGDDAIDGGIGGDTFNYAIGDGVDTIDGGTESDVLLTSGNATAESAVLTVTSTGFTLDVEGDNIVDVNATNIESVVLYQADGADKITVRSQDSAETITIEGNSNLLQVYGNGIPSVSGISTSELTIESKGGNDVINASNLNTVALPPVALTLDGGAGNDTITGSAGADTIYGGDDNDKLIGGKGDDLLDGGSNSAVGFNRPSNPASGDAAAIIASAVGGDTADYSSLTTGVLANLGDAVSWPETIPAHGAVDRDGANNAVGTDTLVDIENLVGGAGDDILAGDGNDNVLRGGAGSDALLGGAGNDLLIGGDDNVSDGLFAGAGNDVLILGNGGGTAKGEGGNDLIYGGSSGDWLFGEDDGNPDPADAGDDIIFAGAGSDHVEGGGGADELYGEDGDDTLIGGKGNDTINGGDGNDTIQWSVGDGLDVIDGGTEPAGGRDLLRVVGSSASEQYAIWSVAAYNAAHPGAPYAGLAEILLTVNGVLAAEVNEIEDIVVQGGGGADTLAVNGSFAGTSLLTSTITYEGGEGDETFDVSELTSGHSVVVKGAGGADVLVIGNDDGESVWKDVTVTQDPVSGEFTISLPNGGPVLKATGVENFRFADGTVTAAQLIEQAPTDLTTSGLTVAENSAAGTVVGSVHGVDVNGSIDPLSYAFILADSSTSLTSADGRFVINASTGEITVAAGAVLDYEATPSIDLSVLVTDSKNGSYSETFSVQLTNVNEAPVLAHAIADQSIAEEGTISFQVPGDTFSDVDSALTYTATLGDGSALPAWLHFDPDTGMFSGDAPLDYNGSIDVMVTASDGPNSVSDTFSIAFTPVNDPAVLTPVTVSLTETNAVLTTGGTLTISDVDSSETFVAQTNAAGSNGYGKFTVNTDGTWTYATDTAHNEFVASQTYTDSLTVSSADGATTTITVNIAGTNDGAVLTPVTVSLTETNAVLTTGGTLTISDVDSSETFVAQTNAAGSNGYGKFTVNTDGTWTYATDTAHNEFVAGQTYTDSITVSSVDGTTTTITVNIAGTSDTPTYSVIADSEGNGQDDAITILASELTGNTSSSLTITSVSNVSSLDLDDGDISNDGKSVKIKDTGNTNGGSFTYELSDGSTGTVSVVRGSTIATPDNGNYVLIGRDGANNSMTGGNGDNTFIGGTSADTIVTGNGVNTVYGGGGNDTITTGNGTNTITGGSGNDRFTLGTGTNTITDLRNGDILVAAGTTVATAEDDWSASSSSGSRSSNDGSATIIAAGHDISVTNAVGANGWTLTNDGNSTNVSLTGSSKADTITGGSGNDTLRGGSGNDTITGGGGNDTIIGGGGGDTLTGGAGSDTFVIAAGDSTPQIGGINSDGTITGYDIITDWGTGGTADKLDFSVAVKMASSISNGVDSTLTIGGDTVEMHTVNWQTGIATFYGTDDFATYENYPPLSINSTQALAAVMQYLAGADIGDAGATLAFNAMGNAYVYQQTGSDVGGTLVQLTGVTLTDIYTLNSVNNGVVTSIDPIILDLDHNGFAFTSVDDGVKFDINADGKLDQVAWTKTDGILAYDVDGNGKIDNGSEIFTPSFAGGAHAGGVAALSTLDVNHDGKIDASDTGFDKLLVWQDANGNGASDEGELKGLNDYGITGISLDADSAEGYIDGQALFAEGTFTYADGSTGSFVEVGFDTLFSDAPDHVLVGTDGDDILAAMPGLTQMTGGAGADTFVLDPSALHELDMADIITDYKSSEGDAVDVSKLLDTLLGHQATGEDAAANVRTTIAGNDTTVSVQVATDSWKDVAVLQNHTEAVKILFDDDKHSANISHV
ncbi:VCBS domain-containing protein [Neorhizobium galegae]|uniref:T1SS-143 repeat domain-containing protein n=3 Tax=Neorhizobium galegae TaxID=399 RepID=UPI00210802EA|nr:VCBS domain-containing protein [Neorhizobium galegae]MCQ1766605.1 VCBS domain-containing protein [Neorhizobium galegae]